MILLTLSRGKGEETVRLQLPASPAEIGETFAFLDRISLDTTATAILDVSSNVPVLYRCLYDVDVEDSEQFQKLQKLAERTEALSPAKAAIFSGALDAECVWNLEGALTVADRLDEYKDQESILMQKNACHDFAEKKGWNIVGEEQEIGVSGYKVSTDDLVKLKRIRKAAEQGEFDILLVFMYDRLGRNLNETPFIAEWFTKKGIHVWSVYEGEIIDGVDAERMLDYIRFWQTDEAQKL